MNRPYLRPGTAVTRAPLTRRNLALADRITQRAHQAWLNKPRGAAGVRARLNWRKAIYGVRKNLPSRFRKRGQPSIFRQLMQRQLTGTSRLKYRAPARFSIRR